ncbi:MAG: hypothetical protein KGI06_05585 [Candidatus Micrarchaeota archaeon]|nr:hypothetical protein [Candidatus Micrarchaeota archaeon]
MDGKQKTTHGKYDISLRKIGRKTIEYSIVAVTCAEIFIAIDNRNSNKAMFNTVQNIDNKVFVDRIKLSGGIKGVLVATATEGCPYTALLDNPYHIKSFSQLQKRELESELVKTLGACAKATGFKTTPQTKDEKQTVYSKVGLRKE